MIGSYWSALLVVWLWQIRASLSYTYELKPQVTFGGSGVDSAIVIGSFVAYGKKESVGREQVALADITYGCPGSNGTLSNTRYGSEFIVVLELSQQCDDYLQAKKARQDGASGVVFYYSSSSSKSGWSSGGYDELSIPVVVVELWDEVVDRLTGRQTPKYTNVLIESKNVAVAPQQRTFYFIVTAFCILILLSCLWFFTSYFRRCRYSLRNRRRQARAQNTARKAISKLKVRTYKVSKGSQEVESCAVCLELYCNNDVIRILPCRHEFHKNCVDPWLKIKHTCPLCKGNITTSKSRNTSTSSSVVTTTTSDDRQRQRRTSSNSVTTPISLSFHSLASSSDSSSGSDTTVTQLNEMRVLTRPAPSAQVAISLEEERESTAPDTEIV
ncbi:RING finger protein 150 [Geodia barretti]|uniref:RING finger protein 150 n=1 Tax=Geodia barretti TaxID=519541 RepID=A0AA35TNS1_GEOBA|nr:RING finger protein 150 [Geodia barretti]